MPLYIVQHVRIVSVMYHQVFSRVSTSVMHYIYIYIYNTSFFSSPMDYNGGVTILA